MLPIHNLSGSDKKLDALDRNDVRNGSDNQGV
jgi:hypothetical protein